VWAEGDILIGGRGSDTIEGRGGNDIIDGDRFLQTRISVRNPFDPAVEIGSTDLMEHTARTGNFGPGTTNMTLQQAVFAGLVNPRYLVAVREIITPTAAETPPATDTAVFSGPQTDYAISTSGDATIVADTRGAARDGTDTLRNIEQLSFCNGTIDPAGSCSVLRTIVLVANLPSVGLSASSLAFPTRDPADSDHTPVTQTMTLTNRGGAGLTVLGSSIVGDDTGSFGSTTCAATLIPGATCPITVSFFPHAPGPLTAQLSIATDVGSPILVPLTGTGLGAPTIAQVSPASVTLGATITITGTDLATTSHVTIAGFDAAFTRVDVTTVTATVPEAVTPASNVPVVVTTAIGTASGHVTVTARPPVLPVVTNVAPASVTLGATITITGTDLATTSHVTIGNVNAPITFVNDTTVTATVPDTVTPASNVPVVVTTLTGSSTGHVTVTARPVVLPVVTNVAPTSVTLGATITITGTDLANATNVTIGGVDAPFTPVNATTVTATVPDTVVPAASVPVVVTTPTGSSSGHVTVTARPEVPPVVPPAVAAVLSPVEPFRLFDTRPGELGMRDVGKSKVDESHRLDVRVTGLGGIPLAGVAAVSLNVTVADAEASGYVTVFPCGEQPVVSSVNFVAGQVVANAVLAPVSADGRVCFYSNVPTNLIVDVNGWYATGTGFNSVAPARVFDTRAGQDGTLSVPKAKVGNGYVLDVVLPGTAGIPPSGVAAVSLNVTVDGPEASGFVTVFPCGEQPVVSSVNFTAGQTVANAVITPLSANGTVCFFSNVPTDLVVDVNGWFATGAGFNRVAPARVFDTRAGQDGVVNVPKTKIGDGYVLDVPFTNLAGLTPAGGVSAVSLNVTVDGGEGSGFVTVFPCGDQPLVSSVNFVAGQIVANAVTTAVSSSGHVCFFSSVPTDLVVDMNAWFAATQP
jgi:IPT/TIG domain/RTX calcium-binding nonapeptide repeat (4 copies)